MHLKFSESKLKFYICISILSGYKYSYYFKINDYINVYDNSQPINQKKSDIVTNAMYIMKKK